MVTMEGAKRKRGDEGESERKKGKEIREDNGGQTATEEEVEEFFAILRRIRVAVKYFEKRNGRGRKLREGRWLRSLELELESESESGLDLNSDPLTQIK